MNEKPLSLPWQPEPEPVSKTKFLGSCNGLVCVYHTSPRPDRSGLILWNPSTRKFRKLPPAPGIGNVFGESTNYTGFGYDEPAGDYKFVSMVINPYDLHPPRRIEFDVFSLKSKTWSSFHHPQPSDIILSGSAGIHRQHPGVLSNGAIHWIICYHEIPHKYRFGICAFDLASQTFRLLEFPQKCEWKYKVVLVSLSGCLCWCSHTRDLMAGCSWIDLWMMKEYGVVSSWTIMASLRTPLSIPRIISLFEYHAIHNSSEECEIVALADHWEREIVRLKVKKGATFSYETLLSLSEKVDTIVFQETFSIP